MTELKFTLENINDIKTLINETSDVVDRPEIFSQNIVEKGKKLNDRYVDQVTNI